MSEQSENIRDKPGAYKEPEMEIIMSNGIRLQGTAAHDSNMTLWLYVKDITMMQIAEIFSEESNMEEISSRINDDIQGPWRGYTRLYAIRRATEGTSEIGLRKPQEEEG